ncbi:MAG: hypothetical protein K6G33_01530 [Ruminococcus sp.]|uniref:hypothetical protein n=1 Tax=Ruminococcus sp. TaxID=41978 RepID=UPI0025CBF580|nr:hypothetical protein [Ruminococcus sp.]MCR5599414.1 hypothetical protein [Ruminococcus sp.]
MEQICLENASEQIKHTDNVRNYEKYLISTLFNEANGRRFKENAEYVAVIDRLCTIKYNIILG